MGFRGVHRSLNIDPSNINIHLNLADSLKYEAPAQARKHLDRVLAENCKNAHALDLLGFTWMLDGDLGLAIEAFDKALEADPTYSRAISHKAGALFLSNKLDEAWNLYSHRYGETGNEGSPINDQLPLASIEDLYSNPVLVWTDQGIGDEILQLSMILDLLEGGHKRPLRQQAALQNWSSGLSQTQYAWTTVNWTTI